MTEKTEKRSKSKLLDPKVAERLRALRKAMGLTQDKIAERGGLPRDAMPRVERGRNLQSFPIRAGLARAFGLSLDDFTKFLDGKLTLEEVRRLQEMHALTHGDLEGWMQAEQEARRQGGGGTAPHEFMGARMMPVLRPPRGPVNTTFVVAVAWVFRHSATEDELRSAIEAERREHPTSSAPPRP